LIDLRSVYILSGIKSVENGTEGKCSDGHKPPLIVAIKQKFLQIMCCDHGLSCERNADSFILKNCM
jgi:hypothetical protein